MGIDVDLVKKLRDETGAGFLACRKAIESSNGDYEVAIDILRKQGVVKAISKADRVTSEGLCCVLSDKSGIAIVKLCCETDFVARNQVFQNLLLKITKVALEKKVKTIEELLQQDIDGGTVNDSIVAAISSIAENITIADVFTYTLNEDERAVYYIHNKISDNCGRIVSATISKHQDDVDDFTLLEQINMHIVAMKPIALNDEQVPADVVSRERSVYEEQVSKLNKPEDLRKKMVDGKIRKFFEENVLLKQIFVLDNEKTVADVINDFNKKNNSSIEIVFFKKVSI